MHQELSFTTEEREAAEDAARALHSELVSLNVDLGDIDVISPCGGCKRVRYRIDLGSLEVDEALEFATTLRTLKSSANTAGHRTDK